MKPLHLNHLLREAKTASVSMYLGPHSNCAVFDELLAHLHLTGRENLGREIFRYKSQIKKLTTQYPQNSLGFFFNREMCGYSFVNHALRDYYTVGESFHLRPLLEDVFVNPEFIVVNVSLYDIKVFKGDFHHIEMTHHFEFESISERGTKRIFTPNHIGLIPFKSVTAMKAIASQITELTYYHSVPVIVTGLTDMKALFLKYFEHKIDVINVDEDFYEKTCLQILEKCRGLRFELLDFYSLLLKKQFQRMEKSKRLIHNVGDIIRATNDGRVINLVLPTEKKLWGEIDFASGDYRLDQNSKVDIINELADTIIRQGGKIQILGPHFFPEETPVYAVLKGS